MSVGLMSSQMPSACSLIDAEIAFVYHFVVDGRRVWRRLIKISFSYTYIQWRCAPGSHTGPRAHVPGFYLDCEIHAIYNKPCKPSFLKKQLHCIIYYLISFFFISFPVLQFVFHILTFSLIMLIYKC